jgi:hypothetical protein
VLVRGWQRTAEVNSIGNALSCINVSRHPRARAGRTGDARRRLAASRDARGKRVVHYSCQTAI